jgi:hypothetical protein
MKSSYELAMERLQKQAPSIKLTKEQKEQIAELESLYKARAAEREIALTDAINLAMFQGNVDEARKLEQQLAHEKKKIAEELEEKKEAVRTGKA